MNGEECRETATSYQKLASSVETVSSWEAVRARLVAPFLKFDRSTWRITQTNQLATLLNFPNFNEEEHKQRSIFSHTSGATNTMTCAEIANSVAPSPNLTVFFV